MPLYEFSEHYFLGSVEYADSDTAWRVTLPLSVRKLSFKIDSGADTSVISASLGEET